MIVKFFEIKNTGSTQTEALMTEIDLFKIPRVGERIYMSDTKTQYKVKSVIYCLLDNEIHIYVLK